MRVMIAAWPSTSHVYPMVPLAWALLSAGHEVRVVSYPSMVEPLLAAGLAPVVLGGDERLPAVPPPADSRLDAVPDVMGFDRYQARLWEFLVHRILPVMRKYYQDNTPRPGHRPMVDDMVEFARDQRPDLVLWDASFLAAPVAARACGAAQARLQITVDYWAWARSLFVGELAGRTEQVGEDPLAVLSAQTAERFDVTVDEELVLGQWTVDSTPQRMRLPLNLRSVPMRAVPYSGAMAVPEWLRADPGRPRVCLTAGLSGRERAKGPGVSIREVLDGLATLDIEVVATLDADQLDGGRCLPSNVRAVDYLPLNLLMPSCAAVIHHGGPGTLAAAVQSGVPQLVSGALASWDNGASAPAARYVTATGAGLALERDLFCVDDLVTAVHRLLDEPGFRSRSESLRHDLLAMPGPAEVVPTLERLAAARCDR